MPIDPRLCFRVSGLGFFARHLRPFLVLSLDQITTIRLHVFGNGMMAAFGSDLRGIGGSVEGALAKRDLQVAVR